MLRIYLPFKKEKESVFKLTDWVSVTKVFFGGNKNFSSAEWTRQERRILRRIWHLHFNNKTHISGSLILSTLSSHFFLFPRPVLLTHFNAQLKLNLPWKKLMIFLSFFVPSYRTGWRLILFRDRSLGNTMMSAFKTTLRLLRIITLPSVR